MITTLLYKSGVGYKRMKLKLIWLILIISLCSGEYICYNNQGTYAYVTETNCTGAQNSQDIYDVLQDFYKGLNGANWYINTNWLDGTMSYCEWAGLECNLQCNITSIELVNNNLTGVITDKISELETLININLFCNYVEYGLSSLKFLTLLEEITLTYNNVHGTIPVEFGQFHNLEILNMQQNKIEGTIPESLGYLKNLTYFNILKNQVEGTIPESFRNLNLTGFLVSENPHLSGNLDMLENMVCLHIVDAAYCNFTGYLPKLHAPLSNSVLLNNNNFNGEIPGSWGTLSSATNIDISHNKISGGLERILYLPRTEVLDASHNDFNTTFPNMLYARIQKINLAGNNFNGPIHPPFVYVINLNITHNPKAYQTLDYYPGIYPQYEALTDYGTYLCPAYQVWDTLLFCDPEFYYYQWCYCKTNNNAAPPYC